MGNYDRALQYINNAIQLRKYAPDYYGWRAKINLTLKKYDIALKDLQTGHHLNPGHMRILEAIGQIFLDLNMYDSCIYYSNSIIKADSTNYNAFYLLTKSYVKKGDSINAIDCLNKFKIRAPQNTETSMMTRELQNTIAGSATPSD